MLDQVPTVHYSFFKKKFNNMFLNENGEKLKKD